MDRDALLKTVTERGEAFAAFVETLDSRTFTASPDGDEWTVAELAGHVSEFPRTFAGEAARLAANLGATVGRQLEDEGRLRALKRLEGRGPSEAAALVRKGVAEAVDALRRIPDGAWDAKGTRVANGEPITVRGIVEMLIAGHLGSHAEQARAAAERARAAKG